MISVSSAWPFRKWGMDIIGPLPEAPARIKYLIVAVDYFTKWFEAKPVTSITGKQVKFFAFDNIVCRTTPKTSNIETPFSLAYGTEVVIPAEIGIPTRRTIQGSDKKNEEALMLNLYLLEERREIAVNREARRKQQVEKYYNQRVHHKQFKVGEFVLRKKELSKVENTGKFRPKWEGPYEVIETYEMGTYKLGSMEGAEIP
ncbi:reverse transcriptase domain-containing protein [Tanacetum coccineum]